MSSTQGVQGVLFSVAHRGGVEKCVLLTGLQLASSGPSQGKSSYSRSTGLLTASDWFSLKSISFSASICRRQYRCDFILQNS